MKFKRGDIIIDRFEVLRVLGVGSQATVYKVLDYNDRAVKAAKVIQGIEFYAEEDLRQTEYEFNLIKQLQHQYIMQGYELIKHEQYYIMLTEFIDGISLDQLVKQRLTNRITQQLSHIDQSQFSQFIRFYEGSHDLLRIYQSFIRLKIQQLDGEVLYGGEPSESKSTLATTQDTQELSDKLQLDGQQPDKEISDDTFVILYKSYMFPKQQQRQDHSWANALFQIFVQLCDTLTYLDQCDIMHRDLKPQNIMVMFDATTNQFKTKLLDFGLAITKQNFVRDIIVNEPVGTQGYISPELYTKRLDRVQPHKCETWALGSVLFFMLAGYQPFLATKDAAYEQLQLQHALYLPLDLAIANEDIPRYFKVVLGKLLTSDVEQRLTSQQAKEEIIRQWYRYSNKQKSRVVCPRLNQFNRRQLHLISQNTYLQVPVTCVSVLFIGDLGIGKTSYARTTFDHNNQKVVLAKDNFYLFRYVDSEGTEGRRCSLIGEVSREADLVFLCCDNSVDGIQSVFQWHDKVLEALGSQRVEFCVLILGRQVQKKDTPNPDVVNYYGLKQQVYQRFKCFCSQQERLDDVLAQCAELYFKRSLNLELVNINMFDQFR